MLFLLMSGMSIMQVLVALIVLLLSLTIHEVAHGVVAMWCGDNTAKYSGRLTLDPRSHLTMQGFIAILLLPIGWGIPVPINSRNFHHLKSGIFFVSIAGIASNLLICFLACLGLSIMAKIGIVETSFVQAISLILYTFAYINIGLAMFNLIPFPPLDGSKLLWLAMPKQTMNFMARVEQWGFIPLFILVYIFSGPLTWLITHAFDVVFFLADTLVNLF